MLVSADYNNIQDAGESGVTWPSIWPHRAEEISIPTKAAQLDEMSESTNRLHSKYGIDYSRLYAMKR